MIVRRLDESRALETLRSRGVEFIHVTSVSEGKWEAICVVYIAGTTQRSRTSPYRTQVTRFGLVRRLAVKIRAINDEPPETNPIAISSTLSLVSHKEACIG